MNSAQMIMNIILKMMYYEDFKSSLTQEEKDFISAIRMSRLKYFRMSSLHERRTIFTWESAIGEVACYASDDGFHFKEAVAYKSSTKRMKDKENEKLPEEKQKILDSDIEELKKIFRTYSENPNDMERYFK